MLLQTKIRSINDITQTDIEEMFGLMLRHYNNASRDSFVSDLVEKQWVIELRDEETGVLIGFSTQKLLDAIVDEKPIVALFSGDTIVDRDYWGSPLLAISWGQLAVRIIESHPGEELYWFLICKGFRTYRFLSVFFQEFGPRYDRGISLRYQRVLDTLATEKFGGQYDPKKGILLATDQTYRVKPEIDLLTDTRRDPHVVFFLEKNPGYVHGDELCCLAPLTLANFTKAAKRLMATTAFARDAR